MVCESGVSCLRDVTGCITLSFDDAKDTCRLRRFEDASVDCCDVVVSSFVTVFAPGDREDGCVVVLVANAPDVAFPLVDNEGVSASIQ